MLAELGRELKQITAVLTAEADRSAYAVEALVPPLVALPATPEEAAACLAAARRHGAVVAPRGGGSKGDLGHSLRQLDMVLSLERLNQVIEYVPEDLTVTVQAGMRYADLERLLAEQGQMLPLDPPRVGAATIGGLIVTGGAGPHRMAYGGVRDLLLGTRVALADGRLIKTGGRVVKNVAGYDLNKVVTGSLGTLGVVTEATFKLSPLPEASRTLRYGFAGPEQALEAAEAILNSELLPVALALLTPGAAAATGSPGAYCLAIHLAESETNVQAQEDHLAEWFGSGGLRHSLFDQAEADFWAAVRDFGDRSGAALRLRVSTVVSDIGNRLRSQPGQFESVAYIGSGTVWVYGYVPDASGATDHLSLAAAELLSGAQAAGGAAVLESAPADLKRSLDVWGPRRPEWRISEGIKRALDPDGILNRGRYVGGI